MPFDDQLRSALDTMCAGLRQHLEADVRVLSERLSQAATSERQAAVALAAEAAAAAARQEVAAEIEQLRTQAIAHAADLQRAVEARAAELQHATDARIAELVRVVEQSRSQIEELTTALAAARQQAEEARTQAAQARTDAQAQAADVRAKVAAADAEHGRTLAAALEHAHVEHRAAADAAATRIRDAVRGLDAARTLGEVLDVLTVCAGREVERAAVLLVRGDRLQGWRVSGFPASAPRPSMISLSMDEAGIAGVTVRTATVTTHAARDAGLATSSTLPAFADGAGSRHAFAFPIVVGGAVVATLYADAPYTDDESAVRWSALLEVLTRHAGRVLESTTLQQATGVAPLPVPGAPVSSQPGGLA